MQGAQQEESLKKAKAEASAKKPTWGEQLFNNSVDAWGRQQSARFMTQLNNTFASFSEESQWASLFGGVSTPYYTQLTPERPYTRMTLEDLQALNNGSWEAPVQPASLPWEWGSSLRENTEALSILLESRPRNYKDVFQLGEDLGLYSSLGLPGASSYKNVLAAAKGYTSGPYRTSETLPDGSVAATEMYVEVPKSNLQTKDLLIKYYGGDVSLFRQGEALTQKFLIDLLDRGDITQDEFRYADHYNDLEKLLATPSDGSRFARYAQGVSDPFIGFGQIMDNLSVGLGLEDAEATREFHKVMKRASDEKYAETKPKGTDWMRGVGNVVGTGVMMPVAPETYAGTALYGAASATVQPVDYSNGTDFFSQKATSALFGATTGIAGKGIFAVDKVDDFFSPRLGLSLENPNFGPISLGAPNIGAAGESSGLGLTWKGSGPAPGTFGVAPDTLSVKGLQNYFPKQGSIEFVFDPETFTFVVGKPQNRLAGLSPHQQLVDAIGADSSNAVGGMFTRGQAGEMFTNEFSGHYWKNWNPTVRSQFVDFMDSKGLKVLHREGM